MPHHYPFFNNHSSLLVHPIYLLFTYHICHCLHQWSKPSAYITLYYLVRSFTNTMHNYTPPHTHTHTHTNLDLLYELYFNTHSFQNNAFLLLFFFLLWMSTYLYYYYQVIESHFRIMNLKFDFSE